MIFLLFGFRTRDKVASRRWMVCEACGVHAPQTVVKRSTKFTLFFIPLFPVKPGTYYMQCDNCGTLRRVDRRAVTSLAA
ncbi:zinc ribbon domain-containing protein [Actinoplanes sp. NPDC051411]|uniref:zinc ribbon domain-containing protein n=1 Tax=Actinoplanes sp. NPDC051411 TaxID=3155522 RepID=UPI00342716A3